MWENLRTKIVAMIGSINLFGAVFPYEPSQFNNDPVAVVVGSDNSSEYRTTSANRRIYTFAIQLWVKRGEPRSDQDSEEVLTDLVDKVLDMFDKYYTLGTGSPGSALVVKTGYTMIRTQALPSAWLYSERETLYRGAEIILKCEMDVDVTQIN